MRHRKSKYRLHPIFDEEIDKDRAVSFTGGQIGVMGYNSTFVVNNIYVYAVGESDPGDDDHSEDVPPADTDTPPANKPDAADTKSEGGNAATIMGIAAGAVAMVCGAAMLVIFMVKKRKEKRSKPRNFFAENVK